MAREGAAMREDACNCPSITYGSMRAENSASDDSPSDDDRVLEYDGCHSWGWDDRLETDNVDGARGKLAEE